MLPIINLGPLALQASGLFLLLTLWIGVWLTVKFSKALGTRDDVIENGILIGLLAGLVGARLGFLVQNPAVFINRPLSLISLTPSMLNPAFGLLVGILALLIHYQKQRLPLWPTLDTLTPLFLLITTGIHLANYANGDTYGLPTALPWGVDLWGATRHPVQLYAIALTALLFIGFLILTKRLTRTGFLRSGVLLFWVVTGLASITLFTQAFVAEKKLLGAIDLFQAAAWLALTAGLYGVYTKQYRSEQRKRLVYLSLGANRQAESNLSKAVQILGNAFRVRTASAIYQTQDVREGKTGAYFNQAVAIETALPYPALVERLKQVETEFGHEPGNKQAVPLDIDIITYADDAFVWQGKRIPAPGLLQYRYIAHPLAEIAPDFRHPATGQPITAILEGMDPQQQPIEKRSEVENETSG